MPRIESDLKLDFKDVLVRPKRSTLKSRADVRKAVLFLAVYFKDSLLSARWTCTASLSFGIPSRVTRVYPS